MSAKLRIALGQQRWTETFEAADSLSLRARGATPRRVVIPFRVRTRFRSTLRANRTHAPPMGGPGAPCGAYARHGARSAPPRAWAPPGRASPPGGAQVHKGLANRGPRLPQRGSPWRGAGKTHALPLREAQPRRPAEQPRVATCGDRRSAGSCKRRMSKASQCVAVGTPGPAPAMRPARCMGPGSTGSQTARWTCVACATPSIVTSGTRS